MSQVFPFLSIEDETQCAQPPEMSRVRNVTKCLWHFPWSQRYVSCSCNLTFPVEERKVPYPPKRGQRIRKDVKRTMPHLEHCYCQPCEQSRDNGEAIRQPSDGEIFTTQEVMAVNPEWRAAYTETQNRLRMAGRNYRRSYVVEELRIRGIHQHVTVSAQIHTVCNYCGYRADSGNCTCQPCSGCFTPVPNPDYHRCIGCDGWTCDGSCTCQLRRILNYSHVPPVVTYRSLDPVGDDSVQRFPVGERRSRNNRYPSPPDSSPFLGLELEWECPGNGNPASVAEAWGMSGHGWTTSDGSLASGAESKTHPSTYAYLAKAGLSDTLREMVDRGARSWAHASTGLHTHLSRAAFARKSHEYVFAWLQVVAFRPQCEQLAGRQNAGYARWPRPPVPAETVTNPQPTHPHLPSDLTESEMVTYLNNVDPSQEPMAQRPRRDAFGRYTGAPYITMSRESLMAHFYQERMRRWQYTSNHQNRYAESPLPIIQGRRTKENRSVAINVNDGTIELRYWKGTLCPESVLGQCAFIDGLYRYALNHRVTPSTRESLNWEHFGTWCGEHLPDTQAQHIADLCATRSVAFAIPGHAGQETEREA